MEHYQQFLFHPEDVPYSDFSAIPKVFTGFRKKCEARCEVRDPLPEPAVQAPENLLSNTSELPSLPALGLDPPERDDRSAFPLRI